MSFSVALSKLLEFEGRYSNNKNDLGKETYSGISRKYNPNWDGWIKIDALKQDENFNSIINSDKYFNFLYKNIWEFYKEKYWDVFNGDDIKYFKLADKLFDVSVNLGVKKAIIFLQIGLNLLNRNTSLYQNILVDGIYGKETSLVLNILLNYDKLHQTGDSYNLFKIITILQGNHYVDITIAREKNEDFLRGWLKRVHF